MDVWNIQKCKIPFKYLSQLLSEANKPAWCKYAFVFKIPHNGWQYILDTSRLLLLTKLCSYKFHPVINVAFLSCIILVSDCDCKWEDNWVVPYESKYLSQYFDLQVHIPGIVTLHKFEISHNHGGIYRPERKFNKNYGKR